MSPADLAREAGLTDATISHLIGKNRKSRQTRVMEDIHRALRWPPPSDTYAPMPKRKAEFLALVEKMSPEDADRLMEIAKSLAELAEKKQQS